MAPSNWSGSATWYSWKAVFGHQESTVQLFKLERTASTPTSQGAVRRSSVNTIEIKDDSRWNQVILSDMSAYDSYDRD